MTAAIAPRTSMPETSPSSAHPPALAAAREPILVALKPYDGHEAALSYARWLASAQHRPLHAVTVLEPNEMAAVGAGVPVLPARWRD